MSKDTKIASSSSSKKSKRAIQKKVVSVPIKDIKQLKSDHISAPPSDSWAWRKYGQKPIKGSPYPRGYYRCSSSKGCPARKQVERSKVDPSMLLVTYYCEHNHPWPTASRNHHRSIAAANGGATTSSVSEEDSDENEEYEEEEVVVEEEKKAIISNQSQELISEERYTNFGEFEWFIDFESTNCTFLESPILTEDRISVDNEMGMIFTMREEDESLFADLGELPECTTVFRRGMAEQWPWGPPVES